VVEVAGYEIDGCTGSAWIAATPRTKFFIWSTEPWRQSSVLKPYTEISLPLATYTDGRRLAWRAQGLAIWLEPGASRPDVLRGAPV
jgi:hypothetical protein